MIRFAGIGAALLCNYWVLEGALARRTDTDDSPWHVIPVSHRSRKGLNCIAHFLSVVPYTEIPRPAVELPEPNPPGDYVEPDYPYRFVPLRY